MMIPYRKNLAHKLNGRGETMASRFNKAYRMAADYAHSQGAKHKNVGGYSWRPRKDKFTWYIKVIRFGPMVTVYNSKTKETIELGPAPQAD